MEIGQIYVYDMGDYLVPVVVFMRFGDQNNSIGYGPVQQGRVHVFSLEPGNGIIENVNPNDLTAVAA